MPLVVVGVLLLLAHIADFGPFGNWPWWAIGLPFLGAVLWWQFADSTGWTQRRAMDKMEQRKKDRREQALASLGLDPRRRDSVRAAPDAASHGSSVGSADPTQRDPNPPRQEPRL